MATLFLETPDATQEWQFWTSKTGTVTYDTTASKKKSGLASWKCDSGAGSATAYVQKDGIAGPANRITAYFCITDTPASWTSLIQANTGSYYIRVGVYSDRKLYVVTNATYYGSTLSLNTLYRITLCYNIASQTVNDVRVYLDGDLDISRTNDTLLSSASNGMFLGWVSSPGASKVVNFQHVYIDDDTSLTDTGDIRVTAKLPDELNDNNYDTTGGTGAVNERPISETNHMMHAAKSSVLQDWTLETAVEGDVDISGDTLVARCAWMWAKSSKDGDTYYIVDDGDSSTGFTDIVVPTLHTKITDSATYPSNAAGIGQKSGAAAPDDYLYECGTLIAYKVAAGPSPGWYQIAYTADPDPPTPNAWNQVKDAGGSGFVQIKFEGE